MREPVIPQRLTVAAAEIASVEWLFEPYWPGDRLMARIDHGTVVLTDELGGPAGADAAELASILSAGVMAAQAVIDGVWSAQPFVGDGSPARAWAETLAQEGLVAEVPDPLEAERRRAFVAVDLVEVDEQALQDVPFQERRRLLESLIDPGVQLRLSPVVKHPLLGWLLGWRANGFTHYVAKHMNSRYLPGERNDDCLKLRIESPTAPGMMARLTGSRERIRRIRD
jgi:ATP-dependent DNA ligase